VNDSVSYLMAAVMLGIGYGLTYSVINGLAANEAPAGTLSQALLLFSLAYFIGVFGFPFVAGKIIVEYGMTTLLHTVLMISLLNWLITAGRLLWRRIFATRATQSA
jgi:MFS family permease